MNVVAGILDTEKRLTYEQASELIPSWCDNMCHLTLFHGIFRFDAARNAILDQVNRAGYDWLLVQDTDAHFTGDTSDLFDTLADDTVDTIQLQYVDGSFWRDCLIRLPAKGRYIGAVHEYYDNTHGRTVRLDQPRFYEDAKDPTEERRKFERYRKMLQTEVTLHPTDGRSWYYLGDTCAILGKTDESIYAFTQCERYSEWDEEQAWSCYRAGHILHERQRYKSAINHFLTGLKYAPHMCELYWSLGYTSYYDGKYRDAIMWSKLALEVAIYNIAGGLFTRHGFRYLPAWYEGPYSVMAYCYRALGDDKHASRCDYLAGTELQERLERYPPPITTETPDRG